MHEKKCLLYQQLVTSMERFMCILLKQYLMSFTLINECLSSK